MTTTLVQFDPKWREGRRLVDLAIRPDPSWWLSKVPSRGEHWRQIRAAVLIDGTVIAADAATAVHEDMAVMCRQRRLGEIALVAIMFHDTRSWCVSVAISRYSEREKQQALAALQACAGPAGGRSAPNTVRRNRAG